MRANQFQQPRSLAFRLLNAKIKVRAVKSGRHAKRIAQFQQVFHVRFHVACCRCSECPHHRADRQRRRKFRNFQVGRTEILSPLRNAVRLVHNQERHRDALADIQKIRRQQALRRNVDQTVNARPDVADYLPVLRRGQRAVDIRRADARLDQRFHLIFHQGNQRRNDNGYPFRQQRRDLIAKRFSRAGRHHAQYVTPRKDRVNDLLLPRAKRAVPEILLEYVLFGHGCSFRYGVFVFCGTHMSPSSVEVSD